MRDSPGISPEFAEAEPPRQDTEASQNLNDQQRGPVTGAFALCVLREWANIADPDSRGRRLRVVLKSWNHQHVATQRHAASNTFSVSVNEELGCERATSWTQWQLDLDC